MREWDAAQIAEAAGAFVVREAPAGPARAVIDSREVLLDDLFVGLRGENDDGGRFAAGALEAGAWGVLVGPEWKDVPGAGAVIVAEDPLVALQSLARAWRRSLGVPVIGVTGSVGKTTTKELIAALLAPQRHVHFSRANFNTEIGLPLELLAAPADAEVIVLEMGMRGMGQIEELALIAEPDVGVITAIGPVHVELVGSVGNVARAKAELLEHVRTAIVPEDEARLDGLIPAGVEVVRFGTEPLPEGLVLPFTSEHMLRNARAAVAAARAVGVEPAGVVEWVAPELRGQVLDLPGGVRVLNDCYNANPLSMRAALSDLSAQDVKGRRIAVLGDMLELGPDQRALHREIGAAAGEAGVDVLVTVGALSVAMLDGFDGEAHAVADAAEAAALAADLVEPGDVVLVKASRGIGLEVVAEALADA